DAAERRNRGARVRELLPELAVELHAHIGVLRLHDEAREAAALHEQVVLVAEAVRLPVERRVHPERRWIPDAVEDHVALQPGRALVLDRDVLQAEMMAARRPYLHPQRPEALGP